jgi:hypothetical protein
LTARHAIASRRDLRHVSNASLRQFLRSNGLDDLPTTMSAFKDGCATCGAGLIVQTASRIARLAEIVPWEILNMRLIAILAVLVAGIGVSHAGGVDVRVMLSGQVVPGVYGQVNIGNGGPPPTVYAQPMVIEPQYAPPPAIYLHVPPDHARNWRKHCHEYNACSRPVYFVRSREYEPEYQRHYQDHAREREIERQRWEERERDHGRGHDDEHGHGHEGHDKHDNN